MKYQDIMSHVIYAILYMISEKIHCNFLPLKKYYIGGIRILPPPPKKTQPIIFSQEWAYVLLKINLTEYPHFLFGAET